MSVKHPGLDWEAPMLTMVDKSGNILGYGVTNAHDLVDNNFAFTTDAYNIFTAAQIQSYFNGEAHVATVDKLLLAHPYDLAIYKYINPLEQKDSVTVSNMQHLKRAIPYSQWILHFTTMITHFIQVGLPELLNINFCNYKRKHVGTTVPLPPPHVREPVAVYVGDKGWHDHLMATNGPLVRALVHFMYSAHESLGSPATAVERLVSNSIFVAAPSLTAAKEEYTPEATDRTGHHNHWLHSHLVRRYPKARVICQEAIVSRLYTIHSVQIWTGTKANTKAYHTLVLTVNGLWPGCLDMMRSVGFAALQELYQSFFLPFFNGHVVRGLMCTGTIDYFLPIELDKDDLVALITQNQFNVNYRPKRENLLQVSKETSHLVPVTVKDESVARDILAKQRYLVGSIALVETKLYPSLESRMLAAKRRWQRIINLFMATDMVISDNLLRFYDRLLAMNVILTYGNPTEDKETLQNSLENFCTAGAEYIETEPWEWDAIMEAATEPERYHSVVQALP